MISKKDKIEKDKLLELIQACIQQDQSLRDEFHIGDKFRFVRDRLSALEKQVQQELIESDREISEKIVTATENEIVVYVYIYNVQGLNFLSWQKLVNPSVFYEYSINRPIYTDKAQMDAFIRSRTNRNQHGYLAFVINQTDLAPLKPDEKPAFDVIGNPVVKIKEGTLKFNKLISFTHQDTLYSVTESGQLKKKE